MDLSAKNDAYRNYLDQAKTAYSEGDIRRAKGLFLKAAEITNEITMQTTNVAVKHEYLRVTQTILAFVKRNCQVDLKKPEVEDDADLRSLDVTSNENITLDECLRRLNNLVGLESVKHQIDDWVKLIEVFQIRKQMGLAVPDMSYHLVFKGNPGTGKTTVAGIVGQIYHALGLFPKGHLIEAGANDLVAGYVGQTAIKTQKVIDKAVGGVLFIDEAYMLSAGDAGGFGQEAINTLVKEMGGKTDRLAIIVAGYDDEMDRFINSNPGLKSRFTTSIHFDDYTADELFRIYENQCRTYDYILSQDAVEALKVFFDKTSLHHERNYGNGRFAVHFFQKTITQQSRRVFSLTNRTTDDFMEILVDDLPIEPKMV